MAAEGTPAGRSRPSPCCTAGRGRGGAGPRRLRALDDPLEDSSSRSLTWRRSACSTRRWRGHRFSMKSSFLASLPEALVRDWADKVSPVPEGAKAAYRSGLGSRDRGGAEDDTAFTVATRFWAAAEVPGRRRARRARRPGRGPRPTGGAHARRALRQRRHRGRRRRRAHDLRRREDERLVALKASGTWTTSPAQPEHHAVGRAERVASCPCTGSPRRRPGASRCARNCSTHPGRPSCSPSCSS